MDTKSEKREKDNGQRAISTQPRKQRDSMRKYKYSILGLLPFIFALVPFPSIAAPAIEHWTTDNGARVYFVPAPGLPMVNIQITFDAGSARDGDKKGVAHLTNSLLDEGAGELNADQIAEHFENLGAEIGNGSYRDMSIMTLRSLTDPQLLTPALKVFALMVGEPSFPVESFERNKKQTLIAIQSQLQSPQSISDKAFFKALYGDHPYGAPSLGFTESVTALTRDDMLTHYQQYYVAKNAVVAMVGDLDRAAAEAIATQLTKGLEAGSAASKIAPPAAIEKGTVINLEHPSSQTHIMIGQPGITRDDPDLFPLYVGNHILGGSGLTSRISDEIREKRGLAYSAYSFFSPMRAAGPYMMGLQTRNDQADKAIEVVFATLQEFINQGVTAEELEAAKRNITGGFPLRIASNSKILGFLGNIGFYNLPLDYLDTYNDRIDAVTIEQIKDAFKRRVQPDKMVTVTVGAPPPETAEGKASTGFE